MVAEEVVKLLLLSVSVDVLSEQVVLLAEEVLVLTIEVVLMTEKVLVLVVKVVLAVYIVLVVNAEAVVELTEVTGPAVVETTETGVEILRVPLNPSIGSIFLLHPCLIAKLKPRPQPQSRASNLGSLSWHR